MRSNHPIIDYDPRLLAGVQTLSQNSSFPHGGLRKVFHPGDKPRTYYQSVIAGLNHLVLFLSISVGLSSLAWALTHSKEFLEPFRADLSPLTQLALPGFNGMIDWQPKVVDIALPPASEKTPIKAILPPPELLTESSPTEIAPPQEEDEALPHSEATAKTPLEKKSLAAILREDASWLSVTVQSGDSLSTIFNRHGLSSGELHQIVSLDQISRDLKNLRPGQVIHIKPGENGSILGLMKEVDVSHELHITRADSRELPFVGSVRERRLTPGHATISGTIRSSLFDDGRKAGLTYDLIDQLVTIFGWDIDFALNIQPGDHFAVHYETFSYQGEEVKTGEILAAEFVNDGNVYRAVRYTDPDDHVAYYTPKGHSLQKAFLRTPVKIGYVTSHFNPKRMHPILNRIKAHKGVDYGAPVGTPIYATGRGVIDFKGRQRGYGKTVVIKHGDQYSTLYAHLSRFADGLKKGMKVDQGQEIGYVGATGLATGPHLHYEFRINGVHKNPLTVELPKAFPIPAEYFADFQAQSAPMLARLEPSHQLARAEASTILEED